MQEINHQKIQYDEKYRGGANQNGKKYITLRKIIGINFDELTENELLIRIQIQ